MLQAVRDQGAQLRHFASPPCCAACSPRHSSLIHGVNVTDVVVTGNNGTIDGQGQSWWARHRSGEENM